MSATELTFTVPSVSCGHCVSAITAEVTQVSGVVDVAIDLETKIVVVRGDALNETTVREAIVEAGYEVNS